MLMADPDDVRKPRRLVLCMGTYCNMDRRAKRLYDWLRGRVDETNGDQYPPPLKLETASCLSMCGAGPNLMLYPDALAFNHLDEVALARVFEAHIKPHDTGGDTD
jgi:(2Fe-2S) ferredoxin